MGSKSTSHDQKKAPQKSIKEKRAEKRAKQGPNN